MKTVGVRELRQHASRLLARVMQGETIAISLRGRVVARMVPVNRDDWDGRLASGSIRPAKGPPLESFRPLRSDFRASDALQQLRRNDR